MDSHEEFERLLATAPVFNFATYDVRPLADMSASRARGGAVYDELGSHRHHVVSERLRERRRDLGLTQKEVVSRLRRMGVTTTNKALSSLEHGAGLDVGKLPELACALECTLTWLVGLTDDPEQLAARRGALAAAPRSAPGIAPAAPVRHAGDPGEHGPRRRAADPRAG